MLRLFVIVILLLEVLSLRHITHQKEVELNEVKESSEQTIQKLTNKLATLDKTLGRAFWKSDQEETICRVFLYKDNHGPVFRYEIRKRK